MEGRREGRNQVSFSDADHVRVSIGGRHLRALPSSLSQMSFRVDLVCPVSEFEKRETVNLNTCCPATLEEKTHRTKGDPDISILPNIRKHSAVVLRLNLGE